MVAVVAAVGDGRRLSRLGPGLHPRCGPCSRWVWIHGWCSNCAEHWHSPALTPRDARGPSTKLIHLSLSRLNHWLPRIQAHPEIVQGTAELHHEIANARLPQADPVLHDAAALDAAVDMLDAEPSLVECLVGQVLLQGQLSTAGLLRRHQDLDLGEREGQEAQIL